MTPIEARFKKMSSQQSVTKKLDQYTCIKGNNCKTPLTERTKLLNVSKIMKKKLQEDLERITSEYGTQLRMNRSIQAEGSFADIKEGMDFRRYLYCGKKNVLTQSKRLNFAKASQGCL